MTNVTQLKITPLEAGLRNILKEVRAGKITYIEMILQREHDDYVEWAISQLGEKSYDVQHLLAQIGLMHLSTQSVVDDMRDIADED